MEFVEWLEFDCCMNVGYGIVVVRFWKKFVVCIWFIEEVVM